MSLFDELKRRNVFKVGVAYVVAAWLLLQLTEVLVGLLGLPENAGKYVILLLVIGFPVALFFAWAFELTPDGVKKEKDVDRSQSITSSTGRKLDFIIIGIMAVAIFSLVADRYFFPSSEQATSPKVAAEETVAVQKPKSIAVLPFADLSQAKDQEWFADGLAEEILNALARTPDLLVSSRTSSFRYKGSTQALKEIASELGVEHILEGSVRSSGNRLRVTAQLIRAKDGFHVWSQNYDREVADMIAIQEDLALNIANALETTMDPVALAAMISVGTHSVESYQEFLRGLSVTSSYNVGDDENEIVLRAYEHFENARAADSRFAAAHVRAADFWRVQITPSRTDTGLTDLGPHEALAEFNKRIDMAIASASTEIDAKGYMAYKALVEMRINESIDLLRAYLEARPNDELTRGVMLDAAAMASNQSVLQEGLEHWHETALSNLDSAISYTNAAHRIIDPSVAADFIQQILKRWPNRTDITYQAHRSMLWAGRIMEARQLMDQYNRLNPKGATLLSARQACVEGDREAVERLLESVDPDENDLHSERWHLLKMLGRDKEAAEELQIFADSGIPYMIADMLTYRQFDPTPYPVLMMVLEREGVKRPPPVAIPFKCPPP